MKVHKLLFILAGLLASPVLLAATFEDVGHIQEVSVEKNTIIVNDKKYSLANSVLSGNSPVIFSLKPGALINFSGDTGSPNDIIKSVYIHELPLLTAEEMDGLKNAE
ncbi:MAG: PilY2 family type 4a fimbrial biogenesis protein [Pseudomonadales bacterium]|jgi:hypothetical protein|uniref:PilY2 family type 4a fimbrial biogenesis protein n=1 Tax=Pseudomonas TaxID=286 RepID=UPI000CBF4EEF|nr:MULTISPECIES: PilY2 family type 4a fimbrial biogenesis protein [Pseudomonas]MDR7023464.1 hypothetical protein [Pseudomonas peli]PJE42771.1 MAG: hypothetical protein CUR33_05455 [Pseudomonas sp.] [Pseudomonas sp. FEMGT703P]